MDTIPKETPEHRKWRIGYTRWLIFRIAIGITAIVLIILGAVFHWF